MLLSLLYVLCALCAGYVVSTLKSYVAPKRPLPRQAFVMQKYRAGALVYALEDCSGFVVSIRTEQGVSASSLTAARGLKCEVAVSYCWFLPPRLVSVSHLTA